MQPALVCPAAGDGKRPLAVCLHTWSYGIENHYEHFAELCRQRNWHFIFPLFRGPNDRPEACGSDLVVSDLESAVEYMRQTYPVDGDRIYLIGGSGGGHASLLMAGRCPELFTAVSSWCPISDIGAWFEEVRKRKGDPSRRSYDNHIEEACGGDPTVDPRAAAEAKHRSPLTWLANATGKVILAIEAGIHDGHTGSVPVSHAIRAFNAVAKPEDRIAEEDIVYMVEQEQVPEHLRFQGEDPEYGVYKVLLRRVSGKVRLTLFEGGHDLLPGPGFSLLERQQRGQEPQWYCGESKDIKGLELTK